MQAKQPIREHRKRETWSKQNEDKSILAFYNTGEELFIDPIRNPPTTFYEQPWQWVPYIVFRNPRWILASEKRIFGGLADDGINFQHCGCHPDDHSISVLIGTGWNRWVGRHVLQTRFLIPPRCILYIATRYGVVKDYLLIPQPLPMRLFMCRTSSLPSSQSSL